MSHNCVNVASRLIDTVDLGVAFTSDFFAAQDLGREGPRLGSITVHVGDLSKGEPRIAPVISVDGLALRHDSVAGDRSRKVSLVVSDVSIGVGVPDQLIVRPVGILAVVESHVSERVILFALEVSQVKDSPLAHEVARKLLLRDVFKGSNFRLDKDGRCRH